MYHERIFNLFFTDKELYQDLVNLTQNIYEHSALISQQPEMAKLRDDYSRFLLSDRSKKEKLFREKYNKPLEIVNNPDFVPIPSGSTQTSFVSGMSPDSISDPVYREQYRKVYDKHKKEVAEKCANNDMHWYLAQLVPMLQETSRFWVYSMYKGNENDKKNIIAIYDEFPEYTTEKEIFLYVINNNITKLKFVRQNSFDKLYAELTANSDNKKILKSEKNVEPTIKK